MKNSDTSLRVEKRAELFSGIETIIIFRYENIIEIVSIIYRHNCILVNVNGLSIRVVFFTRGRLVNVIRRLQSIMDSYIVCYTSSQCVNWLYF